MKEAYGPNAIAELSSNLTLALELSAYVAQYAVRIEIARMALVQDQNIYDEDFLPYLGSILADYRQQLLGLMPYLSGDELRILQSFQNALSIGRHETELPSDYESGANTVTALDTTVTPVGEGEVEEPHELEELEFETPTAHDIKPPETPSQVIAETEPKTLVGYYLDILNTNRYGIQSAIESNEFYINKGYIRLNIAARLCNAALKLQLDENTLSFRALKDALWSFAKQGNEGTNTFCIGRVGGSRVISFQNIERIPRTLATNETADKEKQIKPTDRLILQYLDKILPLVLDYLTDLDNKGKPRDSKFVVSITSVYPQLQKGIDEVCGAFNEKTLKRLISLLTVDDAKNSKGSKVGLFRGILKKPHKTGPQTRHIGLASEEVWYNWKNNNRVEVIALATEIVKDKLGIQRNTQI